MKAMFFLVGILVFCHCSAQKEFSRDSIDGWLNKIDNNTVTANNNYFGLAGMSREAAALYTHADEYVVEKLVGLLDDEEKVLVCHVLLTKLLEPSRRSIYHTSEDRTETIVFLYRHNGLAWKEIFGKTNLTTEIKVETEEMKKIKRYWLQKKGNALNGIRD